MASLQRTLDALDVEGLSQLWKLKHGAESPLGTGLTNPSMEEWVAFVKEYVASNQGGDYSSTPLESMSGEQMRFFIMSYLMSATFKDCSVILRVGSDIPNSITAIDLDPKQINRLHKWELQDRDIVAKFQESVAEGLIKDPCIDAAL